MGEAERLILEVKGVEPETVDARAFVRLAAAFIECLSGLAGEEDQDLTFTRVEVVNKCTAFQTVPSDVEVALAALQRTHRINARVERMPVGMRDSFARLAASIDAFGDARPVLAHLGPWSRSLSERGAEPSEGSPWEVIALRARVIRIGGVKPRVKLNSASEQRAFSLDVSQELARDIAEHLYRQVDIDARVRRDEAGLIAEGQLRRFDPLETEDAPEVISARVREWFRANCTSFDNADLMRARDED